MKNRVNSVFDILKIILAIMIVFLHGKVLFNYIYPWIRIAVPLFFVISSYFLFCKLNKESNEEKRKDILKKFVMRNLKLYLIWFVIFLPLVIINKGYFVNCCFMKGIFTMIKDFFINSTFPTSWFIMALIEGVIIIYFSSKKINNKVLFVLTLLTNIFVIMTCSYDFLFPNVVFSDFYNSTKIIPNNSFIVGLLWIMIGKLFADNQDKIKVYKKKKNIVFIIVVGILFYLEWFLVRGITNDPYKPCYFMLIPFTILIFYYIINIKPFYFKQSLLLRKMSTVIYVSHKAFMIIFSKFIGVNNGYLLIIISIVLSILLTFIVDFLSKHIKFMKNAY